MIPRIDVSRRYFPSCASSAPASVRGAGFSAHSPSRHRPTGLPPASIECGQGRRAPLMRFRLLPSAFAGRAVPPRVSPAPSHPASALFRPRHPRQEVGSPMRFLAPHVWRCCSVACVARRRRAGHSWPISFGPPYRIRAGCYRDLTGTVKVPATPMGFTLHPSQFCFRPRVTTPHRRLGPTCRFGTCHREFHRRGVHRL
jgi:hypothetical protein